MVISRLTGQNCLVLHTNWFAGYNGAFNTIKVIMHL